MPVDGRCGLGRGFGRGPRDRHTASGLAYGTAVALTVVTTASILAARSLTRRKGCRARPWMVAAALFGPVVLLLLALFVPQTAHRPAPDRPTPTT